MSFPPRNHNVTEVSNKKMTRSAGKSARPSPRETAHAKASATSKLKPLILVEQLMSSKAKINVEKPTPVKSPEYHSPTSMSRSRPTTRLGFHKDSTIAKPRLKTISQNLPVPNRLVKPRPSTSTSLSSSLKRPPFKVPFRVTAISTTSIAPVPTSTDARIPKSTRSRNLSSSLLSTQVHKPRTSIPLPVSASQVNKPRMSFRSPSPQRSPPQNKSSRVRTAFRPPQTSVAQPASKPVQAHFFTPPTAIKIKKNPQQSTRSPAPSTSHNLKRGTRPLPRTDAYRLSVTNPNISRTRSLTADTKPTSSTPPALIPSAPKTPRPSLIPRLSFTPLPEGEGEGESGVPGIIEGSFRSAASSMNDVNLNIDAMSPCPIRADPDDAVRRLKVPPNHGLPCGVLQVLGSASSMEEVLLSPSPIPHTDDNVDVEAVASIPCETTTPEITLPSSPHSSPASASISNNFQVLDLATLHAPDVMELDAIIEDEHSVTLDEVDPKRRAVVAAWRIVGYTYVFGENHILNATEDKNDVEKIGSGKVELDLGESTSEEVEVKVEGEQHLLSSLDETIAVRIDLDIPAVGDLSERFPISVSASIQSAEVEDVTSGLTVAKTDVPDIQTSQTISTVETATSCVSNLTTNITQKANEASSSVLLGRKAGHKNLQRTLDLGTVQGELEKVFELRRSARARMISSSTKAGLGSELGVQNGGQSLAPLTPDCHKSSSPDTSVFRIPSCTLSTTTISTPQSNTDPQPEYITENVTTAFGTRRVRRRVGIIPPMTEGSVTSRDPRIQMELSTLRAQKKVGRNVDGILELRESKCSYSPRLGNGSSSLMFRS